MGFLVSIPFISTMDSECKKIGRFSCALPEVISDTVCELERERRGQWAGLAEYFLW
jgi:hypothetical protein